MYCNNGATHMSLIALNTSNYPVGCWQSNLPWSVDRMYQPGTTCYRRCSKGTAIAPLRSSRLRTSPEANQIKFLKGRGYDQIQDKLDMPGEDLDSWGKPDSLMVDALFQWIDRDPTHQQPFYAALLDESDASSLPGPAGQMKREVDPGSPRSWRVIALDQLRKPEPLPGTCASRRRPPARPAILMTACCRAAWPTTRWSSSPAIMAKASPGRTMRWAMASWC